jgi:hypothetical protein
MVQQIALFGLPTIQSLIAADDDVSVACYDFRLLS